MRAPSKWNLFRGAVALSLAVLSVTNAAAAEIKVIASNAVKEAYLELIPEFEKASGNKVTVDWGGTADIRARMQKGEVADLVIIPSFTIDELMAGGFVVPNTRNDLVKSFIGVATRVGAPAPDLSSGEGLKNYLLVANKIILSGGPSGGSMQKMFERWGIMDRIKDKIIRIGVGLPVGEALARGEGDIGFTQVSEFLHIKGIDYRGPLPADVQEVTVFSSGVPRNAKSVTAGKPLVEFVTAPAALPVLKKNGLEPG
jgi:molybdate transport system substrate-binding protein